MDYCFVVLHIKAAVNTHTMLQFRPIPRCFMFHPTPKDPNTKRTTTTKFSKDVCQSLLFMLASMLCSESMTVDSYLSCPSQLTTGSQDLENQTSPQFTNILALPIPFHLMMPFFALQLPSLLISFVEILQRHHINLKHTHEILHLTFS
jgi:hypothetical protein